MGVYIKGMDKPKRCNICPLFRYYYESGNAWCNALNVILESIPYEMRLLDSVLDSIEPHKDCPLVEVKTPHGRLIDEDDFIAGMEEAYCEECKANKKDYNGVKCRACWVDDTKISTDLANTVIEAEVE